MVPYYPAEGDAGHFDIQTLPEKLVSEYTGFNLREVDELNYFVFCLYLRDAAIYRYMQTEKGQEYLKKCWAISRRNRTVVLCALNLEIKKLNGG